MLLSFNLENKITWMELAPSLQELFKDLQSQVVKERERAQKEEKDIKDKIEPLLKLVNMINTTGSDGQVVKINRTAKEFYPHDELVFLNAVDTKVDLQNSLSCPPLDTVSDKRLYDLLNDKLYNYDYTTKTWVEDTTSKPSDILSKRIFIFNPDLSKLYFYTDLTKVDELSVNNLSNTKPSYWPASRTYGNALMSGMVNRIDKEYNTTYWEDYFFILRITSSADETNYEKSLGIDLEEVFNKWQRISSRGSLETQDLDADAGDRNAYGYIDKYGTIVDSHNADVATAFISNSLYPNNFMIKIKITRDSTIYSAGGITPDDDDDALWFTAGFVKDSDGTYHDLSIVRIGGNQNQWGDYQFFLAYDAIHNVNFGRSGGINLNSGTVLASYPMPKSSWDQGECYLKVIKTDGKIEAWTSEVNTSVTDVDPNCHFIYELPSTKPSSMSDSMWYNLNKMMNGDCKIGFGNDSNAGAFMIVDQEYLFKAEVMDLSTDTIWKYINNTWVKIGKVSDAIPPRSLIYNRRLQKLYWYQSISDYTIINLKEDADSLSDTIATELADSNSKLYKTMVSFIAAHK